MRRELFERHWLRSPDGQPLQLEVHHEAGGQVLEGVLWADETTWYPVQGGVPCLLRGPYRPADEAFRRRHGLPAMADTVTRDDAQAQGQSKTAETFSDKWRRFKQYGLEPAHRTFLFDWYCRKLGLPDQDALRAFYRDKSLILEIGPGSGFNSRFMAEQTDGHVIAVDISEAAMTTYENTCDLPNCHVVRADVMDLPLPDNAFDFAIADGVLHHTPDTKQAVKALYRKVKPGGRMFFYVYRQMGPARQFCDQHIRKAMSGVEPQACYEACEGLTELGRELSRLDATITLEKPIPVLGIPAGEHNVQRLLYYNFVKCFWNEAFDFETNNMVNFDWYHPHHAWQHTEQEVVGWLDELGVTDYALHPANPNGLSVLLTRPV